MKILLLFLFIVLFFSSCIIIPTPRHRTGGRVFIRKKTTIFIQPLKTTRSEVLLALGDPDEETCNDNVLIYRWDITWGYIVVGWYGVAVAGPLTNERYLIVGFNDNNTVKKIGFIGTELFYKIGKQYPPLTITMVMKDWLNK